MHLAPLLTFALAIALARTSAAQTSVPEPTALVDAQHCMFCHTPDMPFLAPSFHQIAERYRDIPRAEEQLAIKLRLGGRAHWGDTPMPPAGERGGPLSREQAHQLVRWVLSQ
ncbi:c-type cytochrome [Burkholderia gladioli]|uniref:c-type cytochrome n=1 Tax=Burkholderia gladioli TaxID=28095 RepID=UPI000BBD181E|nr:cytochrome C [Burkholderia gladioli]ATF84198.1 cytochrome C [Burkholderia gladioli pv. gladioli]MBJ9713757.1 cytochrome C [Burkholderia gladioli]MBU9155646.1 cytochrome C [Burkholderia gladioli]MCH7268743.1 cytochrome C [Burkholderia gladioli]MDN7603166.1 cytochrome C [Burkholderia gladioli]